MLGMQKLISVALDVPINQLFDYIVENQNIKIGCRVKVPFGSSTRTGIIVETKKKEFTDWTKFHDERYSNIYPKWPNEILLKLLFGSYLKKKIEIKSNDKILDVGCGFGNNLLPFRNITKNLYGTEVSPKICKIAESFLKSENLKTIIKFGTNKKIPFKDDFFNILLSINVLHYEKSENDIKKSILEYKRVLKKNGTLIIFTVGPNHQIYKKAKVIGNHRYEIKNWDFRNNSQYFYFDNERYLKFYSSKFFKNIETGRVTENLMKINLDFLILTGNK